MVLHISRVYEVANHHKVGIRGQGLVLVKGLGMGCYGTEMLAHFVSEVILELGIVCQLHFHPAN